jgi:hypothetical protein
MKPCHLILALALAAPSSLHAQASTAWSAESALPKSSTTSACRGGVPNNMATLSNGRVYIFYLEDAGSGPRAKYTWSDDHGASWQPPAFFAPSGPTSSLPSVATAPGDSLHVSWASGNSVNHTTLNTVTNTFATPTVVATHPSKSVAFNQVTVDTAGHAHVIWHVGNANSSAASTLAEVWYARKAAGAGSFAPAVPLSTDPAHHAAFPSADYSGCTGGFLAVAWRQTTTSNAPGADWDVMLRTSTDGGATWGSTLTVASGVDRQFDPMLIVDRQNIIHLAYHAYPGSPLTPNANFISIGHSTDGGTTWQNHGGAAGFLRVNPAGTNHSLCKAAYDPTHDIVHFFWKRSTPPSGEDIVATHVLRSGKHIASFEFITDLGSSAAAAFHNFAVGPDGRARCHYNRSLTNPSNPFDQSTIFYRERDLPPALTPELTTPILSAGVLSANYESEYAVTYTVESGNDLTTWNAQPPVTGTGGTMTATATTASNPRFFLRVQAQR